MIKYISHVLRVCPVYWKTKQSEKILLYNSFLRYSAIFMATRNLFGQNRSALRVFVAKQQVFLWLAVKSRKVFGCSEDLPTLHIVFDYADVSRGWLDKTNFVRMQTLLTFRLNFTIPCRVGPLSSSLDSVHHFERSYFLFAMFSKSKFPVKEKHFSIFNSLT